MANNYTQGTVSPNLRLRPEHIEVYSLLSLLYGGALMENLVTTADGRRLVDKRALQDGLKVVVTDASLDKSLVGDGLSYILENSDDEEMGLELEEAGGEGDTFYLYADDRLEDRDLAFLEWVLRTSPEDKLPFITVEFAHTCSKMRAGEFGGGAWFITRSGTEMVHTGSWLYQREVEFRNSAKGGASIVVLDDGDTWALEAQEVLVTAEELERLDAGESLCSLSRKADV
jgi:hypothetical protein